MTAEAPVADIVERVLGLLLPRMGADGRRGPLIAVFTGATVGLEKAIAQCRALIIAGFELRLVFSDMADHLYGDRLREELAGFPQWSVLPSVTWYRTLREARAVVVPMLSANSLSKVAQLLADGQTSNIILHGLFSGKPVILARTGVELNQGRIDLGFHKANQALLQAVEDRLRTAAQFGCLLADINDLCSVVEGTLPCENAPTAASVPAAVSKASAGRSEWGCAAKVITAGDIMSAHGAGADIRCVSQAVVTPLARDAAAKLGIRILRDDATGSRLRGGTQC
jgi:hypothetical protein